MRFFLSYRHDGSQMIAGRIADQLVYRYQGVGISRDIVGSSPQDFAARVEAIMPNCDAVLVVIGQEWLQARSPLDYRWQDDPYDPVAIEIGTAMRHGKLIVPLLVHGAAMPSASDLPPALSAFTLHQGVVVRGDPMFQDDMQKVYAQINSQLRWRPASWPLLVGAVVLFVALFIFEAELVGITSNQITSDFNKGFAVTLTLSLYAWLIAFFGTLIGAFVLAIRRHQQPWLWGLGGMLLLGIITFPFRLLYFWLFSYAIVVGIFALLGKRREMA